MTDADLALVRDAQKGSRTAFEELVRRTSRLLYARLYLETGDAHLAEDLVQESFLAAFRSLPTLKDTQTFRSWLLTIADRTLIDARRRDARKKRSTPPPASSESLDRVAGRDPAPEACAQEKEMQALVLDALRSLPEEYRLPLSLRYLAGADYATIQTQLGLSNGSLRGLLHRGMSLLRERLPKELSNSR